MSLIFIFSHPVNHLRTPFYPLPAPSSDSNRYAESTCQQSVVGRDVSEPAHPELLAEPWGVFRRPSIPDFIVASVGREQVSKRMGLKWGSCLIDCPRVTRLGVGTSESHLKRLFVAGSAADSFNVKIKCDVTTGKFFFFFSSLYNIRWRPGFTRVQYVFFLFTSVTPHPSIFLCRPPSPRPRPSGVPSSHCAASRLILPSPITEGRNYGGCRPPSGEPFVMWTGLDRAGPGWAEMQCAVLL